MHVFVEKKCNYNEYHFIMTMKIQNYSNRMMGYSTGQHTMNSHFGLVPTNFVMDNVVCTGNEASLLDCPYAPHNCNQHEGAGVICANSG